MFEKSNSSLMLLPADLDPRINGDRVSEVCVESSPSKHSKSIQRIEHHKSSVWVFALMFLAATGFNAAPWLFESAIWLGLLGIVITLNLTKRMGSVSGFLLSWLLCIGSVSIAFHWSPEAMAYTLSSSLGLGLLVTVPLVLWDGLRMSLGYWIAGHITTDIRFHWLAAASMTILFEYIMPGVFPWKVGYVLLPIPWTIQAVDFFGPSFTTFVAFAFAGTIQLCVHESWRKISYNKETHDTTSKSIAKSGLSSIFLSPAVIALAFNFAYSFFAWVLRWGGSPLLRKRLWWNQKLPTTPALLPSADP